MNIVSRAFSTSREDISLGRVFRAIKRRIVDIPQLVKWYYPYGFSKQNRLKLIPYKNIHAGERCFIIANGPSLQKTDLSLLKNELTIGMNRIYLVEEVNGFSPTYLAVSDIPIQLDQFTEEYNNLRMSRFFIWNTRKKFSKQPNLMFFKQSFKMNFQPDLLKPIGAGKSVTYFCIQLAYYMGFDEVILIGKDHSYDVEGKPGEIVISDGKEQNHFIKGYYKPSQKWKIPNYKEEEYSYKLARNAFENDGRKIYDATIGGKLDVLEKVDYRTLFKTTPDNGEN
jgi:hypothetical protein